MPLDHLAECLASGSESQRGHAEVFEVVVGAAGFLVGQAAEAAVDGLTLEAGGGVLDFGDDVAARELRGAGALLEPFDCVEDASLQLGRGSASSACSGGTVMAGPWMVSWRFVLCKPKPTTRR